jgi:hypothetical protein
MKPSHSFDDVESNQTKTKTNQTKDNHILVVETPPPWQQKLRLTLSDFEAKPRVPFQSGFEMVMGVAEMSRL